MISHTHKCIFVHIPKTAGTSIESAFGQLPSKGTSHLQLSEYMKNKSADNYFKFSFIRNTYDRVWSIYKYFSLGGNQHSPTTVTDYFHHYKQKVFNSPFYTDIEISKKMPKSFEEFCEVYLKNKQPFFRSFALISQLEYIAVNGEISVDFLGRFECLEKDYQILAQKFNLQKTLPHLRKRCSSNHYSKYYNSRIKKIVSDFYQKEIDCFGYIFDKK